MKRYSGYITAFLICCAVLAAILLLPRAIAMYRGWPHKPYTWITAASSHADITSYAKVSTVKVPPSASLSIHGHAWMELPPGSQVTLENGVTILLDDYVTIDGKKYGTQKNAGSILIEETGRVLAGKTLRAP